MLDVAPSKVASNQLLVCKLPADVLDKIFEALHWDIIGGPWSVNNAGQLRWPLRGSAALVRVAEIPCNQGGILPWLYDPPFDLMRCRLTCRMFNDLAARWVWKRLVVHSGSSIPTQYATRTNEICTFLQIHPEIGSHVRYLKLNTGTAPASWDRIQPTLTNLRVLRLIINYPKQIPANKTLHHLLSTPSLHTVIFEGDFHPFYSSPCTYHFKNFWMQYEFDQHENPPEWSHMPSLESLYYDGHSDFRGGYIPMQGMPWSSLRQLAMSISSESLQMVARSFKTWKTAGSSKLSPLNELSIFDRSPDPDRVQIILDAFGGQGLTKLVLRGIKDMTISLLDGIVVVFPDLLELTLDDSSPNSWEIAKQWDGSLSEYACILEKLKLLEFLEWNYITPFLNHRDAEQTILACVQMLQIISDHCPCLIKVNFTPIYHRESEKHATYRFLLVKDEGSDDKGAVILFDDWNKSYGESYNSIHHNATTAWRLDNNIDV